MSASRPKSVDFWAAYLNYTLYPQPATVWDRIGGSVGKEYGPTAENTCAARVSYGLNYSGATVVQFVAASRNFSDQSYNKTRGDGKRYVVSAAQMAAYLKKTWGKPDHSIKTSAALKTLVASLAKNQCAIFATPNPPGGHGHAGVLKQGYQDPYVEQYVAHGIDVWILP